MWPSRRSVSVIWELTRMWLSKRSVNVMWQLTPMWKSVMWQCQRNCLHVSLYTHEYDISCNRHWCHWHSQRLIRAMRCNRLGIFIFPLGARQGMNKTLLPWQLMVHPTHLLMHMCIHTKPFYVVKGSPIINIGQTMNLISGTCV